MIRDLFKKDLLLLSLFSLILLRPVAEAFNEVKDNSIFLSPLYLSAALLLVIFVAGILKAFSRQELKLNSFIILGCLISVSALFILANDTGINTLISGLKLVFPVLASFFFYLYFKTRNNFRSLFYVLALAAAIPLLLIIYEIFFGPIDPYIPGGRSVVRYRGPYADGSNYTIYWLFAFLLTFYFYIKGDNKKFWSVAIFIVTVVLTVSLFYLSQAVAYAAFASLLAISLLFVGLKNRLHAFALLLIVLVLSVSFYQYKLKPSVDSLMANEMAIVGGERNVEAGFNGRINIWIQDLNHFKQLPVHGILFGAPVAGSNHHGITAAAHNDFVRILISTGVIGLALYLYLLFLFLKKVIKLDRPEKFLGLGLFIITILLSVSLTPTFYITFLNFAIPISVFLWKSESFSNQ